MGAGEFKIPLKYVIDCNATVCLNALRTMFHCLSTVCVSCEESHFYHIYVSYHLPAEYVKNVSVTFQNDGFLNDNVLIGVATH